MRLRLLAAASLPLLAFNAFVSLIAADSQLRQVIVLSRHGVRGPYGLGTETPSKELLDKYVRNPEVELPLSAAAWGTDDADDPDEVVSPKLTKHGYRVVERMGEYFRDHLYREFLDVSCHKTFAYADANERDNLTARAFLSGLYPTCKDVVPIMEETQLLFEQGQDPTANCPVCSRAVYEGIVGRSDTQFVVNDIREEIEEINSLLQCCAPTVCASSSGEWPPSPEAQCGLFDIPTSWNGAFYLPWKDTLSDADYFSEWLLLQSLNNMTLPGTLTFDKILRLARIHETHMDLITNEVNAASFGATLLAHLTASFEQSVLGRPLPVAKGDGPRILQATDNQLVYYAAHDINILYVRNLLRLEWYASGWHPHQPVPGGMLVFELHSDDGSSGEGSISTSARRLKRESTLDGDNWISAWAESSSERVDRPNPSTHDDSKWFVKLFFVAASPEQIRNGEFLSPENPPDRVPVIIPTCSEEIAVGSDKTDVRCPFATFKRLIGKTLRHECVADTLRPFIDSLETNATATSGKTVPPAEPAGPVATASLPAQSQSLSPLAVAWTLFGALIVCLMAIMAVQMIRQRSIVPSSTRRDDLQPLL